MKRVLAALLAVMMVLSLAACGGSPSGSGTTPAPTQIGRASCRERVLCWVVLGGGAG